MKRLEELNVANLKIYQDDELYKFTSDAVILSRFASVKKGDRVADFCSGSGIVSLHLYGLNQGLVDEVTLFEMQQPLYEMSKMSIEINGLSNIFTAVNTKVQDVGKEYNERFSLIVLWFLLFFLQQVEWKAMHQNLKSVLLRNHMQKCLN